MQVLISGASGLIGSALAKQFKAQGHRVLRLVRSEPAADDESVYWDVAQQKVDGSKLEGLDAVVHLAGAGIADGRWTRARKAAIRESRIAGTSFLSQTLAGLRNPPKVLASASGAGFYGPRGEEELTEQSAPGTGFLAELAQEWENSTAQAVRRGIRVAHLRFGMVLTTSGGALAKMLPPFRLGLGGVVGNGKQYWSWIALEDAIEAIGEVVANESLAGPVNMVAPHPVPAREFTKVLGAALSRPTIFPLPAFAARIALGEMADETLLASTRVLPAKLIEAGFAFGFPDLRTALDHALSR